MNARKIELFNEDNEIRVCFSSLYRKIFSSIFFLSSTVISTNRNFINDILILISSQKLYSERKLNLKILWKFEC